jgi:hypothetical protein
MDPEAIIYEGGRLPDRDKNQKILGCKLVQARRRWQGATLRPQAQKSIEATHVQCMGLRKVN